MLAWSRNLLVLLTLLAVVGGQWTLLQSVAWTGMLFSHLRHDSLQTAIAQTFDGQHPCPLCKAIESSKQSEKKSEYLPKISPIEFPPLPADSTAIAEDFSRAKIPLTDEFSDSLTKPPLTPPPRAILT